MKKLAVLRVCASCEWIYKMGEENSECPKCGFGSYSARSVYGNKAYRYHRTQEPWKEKKMGDYRWKLSKEVNDDHISNGLFQNDGFKSVLRKMKIGRRLEI